GEPGNYVGDFLVGHRFARHVSTPVRGAQFRTASDNNRAQSLIANQGKKRIVRDGAALCSPASALAVAGCAVSLVNECASHSVARRIRRVGRWISCIENSALAP